MSTWKQPPPGQAGPPRPALFLDRDGVVIADADYLARVDQVHILPGVPEAMARARRAGFLLVGVSNQSGIGRGYFQVGDFQEVMAHLDARLALAGADFDSFHYCPHSPEEGCPCRKPQPGLLEEALEVHAIDLKTSWMIGDKQSDIALGRQAGVSAVLVNTGHGPEERARVKEHFGDDDQVHFASDLVEAIGMILATGRPEIS